MEKGIVKLATGQTGYWNGKVYGGQVYLNLTTTGLKADVCWKKSSKFDAAVLATAAPVVETAAAARKPLAWTTSVEGWMAEMARADRA